MKCRCCPAEATWIVTVHQKGCRGRCEVIFECYCSEHLRRPTWGGQTEVRARTAA